MGTMAVLKNYFREQHAERHAGVRHRCPIEPFHHMHLISNYIPRSYLLLFTYMEKTV
jgi:hypothetical protein